MPGSQIIAPVSGARQIATVPLARSPWRLSWSNLACSASSGAGHRIVVAVSANARFGNAS